MSTWVEVEDGNVGFGQEEEQGPKIGVVESKEGNSSYRSLLTQSTYCFYYSIYKRGLY